MLAVRYVALVALLVWLGAMVTALFGHILQPFQLVAFICGAVILISLFVMKFVGPPPHAFVPRAALTAVMLLIVALSGVLRTASAALMMINMAIGLILLFWYVRE